MSTARELGFTGKLAPDAGRNADGIYHDITREIHIPRVLSQGAYNEVDWHDIAHQTLASGQHHSQIRDIAHMVLSI